jgi:hypothetical protein
MRENPGWLYGAQVQDQRFEERSSKKLLLLLVFFAKCHAVSFRHRAEAP